MEGIVIFGCMMGRDVAKVEAEVTSNGKLTVEFIIRDKELIALPVVFEAESNDGSK